MQYQTSLRRCQMARTTQNFVKNIISMPQFCSGDVKLSNLVRRDPQIQVFFTGTLHFFKFKSDWELFIFQQLNYSSTCISHLSQKNSRNLKILDKLVILIILGNIFLEPVSLRYFQTCSNSTQFNLICLVLGRENSIQKKVSEKARHFNAKIKMSIFLRKLSHLSQLSSDAYGDCNLSRLRGACSSIFENF